MYSTIAHLEEINVELCKQSHYKVFHAMRTYDCCLSITIAMLFVVLELY